MSIRIIPAILLLALPLACGGGEADTAAASSSTGDSSSTGVDLAQFYGCEEQAFGASPLAGPGWDAEKGGIQGALQGSYVLHTTQIYIRPEKAQEFGALAMEIGAEAAKIDGLIAFSAGSDSGCGVARTIGIWADEEAMYKLVTSEAHARAMAATLELSYTGRTTHWSATAAEANAFTWEVARAKLADVEPSALY